MKLGIGSYTYTWAVGVPGHMPAQWMTPIDLCRRASALGVRVVQLCDNTADPWPTRLRNAARRAGIQIEVGGRGLAHLNLMDALDMARFFGATFFRLVIDTEGDEPSPEETVRRLRHFLPSLPGGMCIALENHDRFPAQTLVEIIKEIGPDRIGITLDTVNSFGALEGPEHVVKTLAPYVLSLHVKDFTIRRVPSQMGFVIEGCPAGEGRLDIPWLLDCIRAAGRDPNAIIELWTPPADTLEETIAREADWAERSVKYMRTLLPD
jgi:sugar phosphate isomerase/epimerase